MDPQLTVWPSGPSNNKRHSTGTNKEIGRKEKNKGILFPHNPDFLKSAFLTYINSPEHWQQHDQFNKIMSLLEIALQLPESNSHVFLKYI